MLLVLCDFPHEADASASTISLALERETIQLDICDAHRAELIDPLIAVGRTLRKPGRKPAAEA